jgi:DNA (cytosine-5)-methyltransferase 1
MKPRILDLFCGAGGASMGYYRAGFEVVGVDINPQPHYPFEFRRMDAVLAMDEYVLGDWKWEFDAIHASPPCQAFTSAQAIRGRAHPDLLTPIRKRLEKWGATWVIENVPGAPMRQDVVLCGSMFGLQLKRHRWFELSFPAPALVPPCDHDWQAGRPVGVYGHTGGKSTGITSGNHGWLVDDWKRAMGIDWMNRDELAESIPPAYTEFIGEYLMGVLR